MDKKLFLNEKSLFGANSSRSIKRAQLANNGSQTSRSHYNTSICEIEKGNECKKIMTDFLEQSRNRLCIFPQYQATFQFLDSRSGLSQNVIRSRQPPTALRLKQSSSQYSRKWAGSIPFEKSPTIDSQENKRLLVKEAEKQFQQQVNGLNKQEIISKMELFITAQLMEDFKELASLFQVFMKEVQINHMSLYKQQANSYKQSELYQNNEQEAIIKNQKQEILNLKHKIDELKLENIHNKTENQKILQEFREVLNNERATIKQLKQKLLDYENKQKKYRILELDNQALQQKMQFYENKLSKISFTEEKHQKRNDSPFGKNKFGAYVNQQSKQSLSSNTLNQDSYSLNQIEMHHEKIVEVRSVEIQVDPDFLCGFQAGIETQTEMTLIDLKYDEITQENIEMAKDFEYFNQQSEYQITLDEILSLATDSNAQIPYEVQQELAKFTNLQAQQTLELPNTQQPKPRSSQASRQSVICRQSIRASVHKPTDFKQKQIISFINFQKFKIHQLTNQLEEINSQLQETYTNLDQITKQNAKLEEENLQLKLNIGELTSAMHEMKHKHTGEEHQEMIKSKLAEIKHTSNSKQKENQPTVSKGPQLGQRIVISYDFQKNQSKLLIEKVKQKKFGKIQNLIPLKLVLKYITILYQEKIYSQNENKLLKDQDIASFIYNYYLKQYGYTKVTEQRFLILVISVQKNVSVLRVNVFARFLGLLEEQSNFTLEEQKKYLEALDLVNNLTNLGTTIKNNEANAQQYVPYIRALSYLESLYYFKSQDKYAQLKSELDSIIDKDPTNSNRDGVLDFDQMMLKVLRLFRDNVKNIQTFVINAFNASDLDGNGMCQLDEWLTLNKYIENKKYDQVKLSEKFMENADLVCDGEKYLSFDRFSILCMELDLFSDNSQNTFLSVKSNEEVLLKFGLLRENWSFEYQNQVDRINSSKMDQESKDKWLEILTVLDDHIVSNPEQKKPILIAWQIYLLETEQYFNQAEEIQE